MKRSLIFGLILWFCLTVGASQSRLKMEGRKTTALKTQLDSPASSSTYWARHYGGSGFESLNAQEASDNGYIACGRVRFSSIVSASGDIWLVKLDEDGYIEWQKTYGDIDNDGTGQVRILTNGDYLVSGSFTLPYTGEQTDGLVMCISPNGEIDSGCGFYANAELLVMDTFVQPEDIQSVVRDTNVSSYPSDIIPQETTEKCHIICGYYKKKGTIKR